MSLLVAWLVFPLILGALCLGAGLLVERAAGRALPGVLLVPLGLALIVVVSQAATYWDATAELATPLVVALGVLGLASSRRRLVPLRIDGFATAAALGVFAVFAAPVFLSGEATFAGYTLLGDTSVHFALIDRVMHHGSHTSGLPPSSYRTALDSYFFTAYPLGAHTALGAVRPLVGQDIAWVFQPFLAALAAVTALSLYGLIAPVVPSRPIRALAVFVAAQPALVVAYGLEGSIKELATIWIIAMIVALVPLTVAAAEGLRRFVPLALTTAAGMGVLSVALAPWLGPLLLACLVLLVLAHGRARWRLTAREALAFTAIAAALSFPALLRVGDFVERTEQTVTASTEFGNLLRPLDKAQMFGIWPSGDFRLPPKPTNLDLTYILIGLAIAGCVLGLAWAIRRRALAPLLYLGVSLIGWAYATRRGSPWIDAKALAIVSPALVLFAMLGAAALFADRPVEGALLGAAITLGVLWSNAYAYHDVDLAPRGRLTELQHLDGRISGQGPTLYPEFEEFAKHFVRDSDPTGSTESWQPGEFKNSRPGRFGFSQDVDELPLDYVLNFRTILLRRSPSASRPPSVYHRVWSGRYYEVWQRPSSSRGAVRDHVALGGRLQPAGRPRCAVLSRLAREARASSGRLAYVERPLLATMLPTKQPLPGGWNVDGQDRLSLRPAGPGRIEGSVRVRSPGRYDLWLQGSFGRATGLLVDGRSAGSVSYQLNPRYQYAHIGTLGLGGGVHSVKLERGGGDLRPGNGGGNRLVGPVVLSPAGNDARRVETIRGSQVQRLCGRRLDWVEVVGS